MINYGITSLHTIADDPWKNKKPRPYKKNGVSKYDPLIVLSSRFP